ncbi:MAG TPA: S28 family serine protease [Candidatus Aminicenantes bacterium]|nr:S28 family serine protease [Candidatus Aminicenantes bacterium]HRY64745.1 S28 family serine protease [Candidatus Aminicenantes bacterium]HRZ71658.1 S28 family serine protease [Candidatus Aminicenantes bacterium]
MKTLRSLTALLVGLLFFTTAAPAQGAKPGSELLQKIQALPGVVEVKAASFDNKAFREAYEVMIEQPLDHENPAGAKFRQRVFLAHAGYDKPVVLVTEGYGAYGSRPGELTRLLAANQVNVEHRFFGRSVPDPLDWTRLTVRQSADDLHAIVAVLKAVYPGKWISTGASKSGQTALFYKTFYPDDVDATVPYSAPINIAQEDPRLYRFLETAGDEATRTRIKEYQKAMFRREAEILPLVGKWAAANKWTMSLGLAGAYEYGILEYLFNFWQSGSFKPEDIPAPDAPVAALFEHYKKSNTFFYYTDQGQKAFEPFLYQAFTEIGYYNYDIGDIKGLMKALTAPTNGVLCPKGVPIVFDPRTMDRVYRFLQYEAERVAYIYGELDTWAATQVPLIGRTDAIKIVVKGAHHGVGIRDFAPDQKDLFFHALERWLGVALPRT